MELINPILGAFLQVIPKIPNSAIAILICIRIMPNHLKTIRIPINVVKWAMPFLIIATINLPFVEIEKKRCVLELVSAWFWVIVSVPLIIRVLSTPSGRQHFVIFSTLGATIMSVIFFKVLNLSSIMVYGDIEISRNHLTPCVILVFPLLLGYIGQSRGVLRTYLVLCLTTILISTIPAGSRTAWIIMPIELILIYVYILPKSRFLIGGIVLFSIIYGLLAVWGWQQIYSDHTFNRLETRIRKTKEWKKDETVWKRFGMVIKTKLILEKTPWLGVGYSNRSFASFNAGDVDFMGHIARVRRIDAHNTYLNILGGTGILGFSAFFYFMWKVLSVFLKIPTFYYKKIDVGPFIISTFGMSIYFLTATASFSVVVHQASILVAIFLNYYNNYCAPQTQIRHRLLLR